MSLLFENKIKKDKENQPITCGMFYCRASAKINGSGSLQTSSRFDSELLRNRQEKHTANCYRVLMPLIIIRILKNHKELIKP